MYLKYNSDFLYTENLEMYSFIEFNHCIYYICILHLFFYYYYFHSQASCSLLPLCQLENSLRRLFEVEILLVCIYVTKPMLIRSL